MTFKLHIPGLPEAKAPPVANSANPLIDGEPVAANDRADRISGLAGLAGGETRDDHEAFEERAAIMEFDGGLSRPDAEVTARACVTCEFQSRRKTCLEPVLAGLAPHFSIRFCEQVPDAGVACAAYKGKS